MQYNFPIFSACKDTPDDSNTTLVITEYPCYDCDLERRKKVYSTAVSLKEHLM